MILPMRSTFGPRALGMPLLGQDEGTIARRTRGGIRVDFGKVAGDVNVGGFVRRLKDVIPFELEKDVIFCEGAGWLGGDIVCVRRCRRV